MLLYFANVTLIPTLTPKIIIRNMELHTAKFDANKVGNKSNDPPFIKKIMPTKK